MGFWSRVTGLFERKYSTHELFRDLNGWPEVKSGARVTAGTALEVSTVLACCRVIANGVAQVPFRVYQETDGGKRVAADHPLYPVVYRRPNRFQTSFGFRETLIFHVLLAGNAYVWVGRVGRGREVRRLDILEPRFVTMRKTVDGEPVYDVRVDGAPPVTFSADDIWHIRGPSWDALKGLEAVKLAREAIGLAMVTEEAHARFHVNAVRPSGMISVDGTLNKDSYDRLRKYIDTEMTGNEQAGKVMIADRAAKFQHFTLSGVDAQHVESRKYQVEEICRGFGVMPIMIGHADKTATYASAEQMFLAHVVHTLAPWYERLEQSGDLALLSDADRDAGYYLKFTPNALMRGAAADRAEFYTKALGAGGHGTAWMTPNEVRALEELDPRPDGDALPKPEPAASAPQA